MYGSRYIHKLPVHGRHLELQLKFSPVVVIAISGNYSVLKTYDRSPVRSIVTWPLTLVDMIDDAIFIKKLIHKVSIHLFKRSPQGNR